MLGQRTSDEDYSNILPSLKRPHMDYLHDFYGDTRTIDVHARIMGGIADGVHMAASSATTAAATADTTAIRIGRTPI